MPPPMKSACRSETGCLRRDTAEECRQHVQPPVPGVVLSLTIPLGATYRLEGIEIVDECVRVLQALEGVIDDPLLRTRISEVFRHDQFERAMAYQSTEAPRRCCRLEQSTG